jgi:ABC-type Fe3+-citrate transport system substrate-binding protein
VSGYRQEESEGESVDDEGEDEEEEVDSEQEYEMRLQKEKELNELLKRQEQQLRVKKQQIETEIRSRMSEFSSPRTSFTMQNNKENLSHTKAFNKTHYKKQKHNREGSSVSFKAKTPLASSTMHNIK